MRGIRPPSLAEERGADAPMLPHQRGGHRCRQAPTTGERSPGRQTPQRPPRPSGPRTSPGCEPRRHGLPATALEGPARKEEPGPLRAAEGCRHGRVRSDARPGQRGRTRASSSHASRLQAAVLPPTPPRARGHARCSARARAKGERTQDSRPCVATLQGRLPPPTPRRHVQTPAGPKQRRWRARCQPRRRTAARLASS